MNWWVILLLVISGIGIGLLIAFIWFAAEFTDNFKNFGP